MVPVQGYIYIYVCVCVCVYIYIIFTASLLILSTDILTPMQT